MRSSSLLLGLSLFALVPIVGCSHGSTDDEESGHSEDAVGTAHHRTHAAAIATCASTYDAEPHWTAQEAIGAAERFHGCLMAANDRAVATMSRRTGSNDYQASIDTYRNDSNAVCAGFFNLDGPVIIDNCVARREELLAQLIGAYGDLGETRVPVTVENNAYAQCWTNVLDFPCVDAQARLDATEIVKFGRAAEVFPVLQRDARDAKTTCQLLVLRAPAAGPRAPADPNLSNDCTVHHLGRTAVIGRTTRP
jgi:hypothetical protein